MNSASWANFFTERLPELWLRTGEHLMLTGLSTGLAILIGVPIGIFVFRMSRLRGPVVGLVGIIQTIPSLAMLVFLLALFQKIGALPALVALTLYALLPIVRNTLAGLQGVSEEVMEAARGIGMTEAQQLWMVRIPLALPVIVAGIRTAAVVGVGIATLSAFIGAGGLGQFINRGLALSDTRLILLGAIPAALLALVVDFALGAAGWGLRVRRPRKRDPQAKVRAILKPAALALPALLLVLGLVIYGSARSALLGKETVRIGTKNFTEQLLLGELMAQLIEARTDLSVERKFNLGGTMICHGALVNGEIDLYVEYTGTGLTTILKRSVIADPVLAYRVVATEYRKRFDVEWLQPFGFNNTYALTVRAAEAEREGWRKISDLASDAGSIRAGFTAEFSERPDGYPGLRRVYGYDFGEVRDLDPGIMYDAITKGEVDVITAFSTDGRIAAFKLKTLRDDKGFFPPYHAAPVVRGETLRANPELQDALASLAGALDNETMRRLNYEVAGKKRSPAEVARAFLKSLALVN